MRRASGALALVLAIGAGAAAIADDLDGGAPAPAPVIALPAKVGDARDAVREGLAAQLAVARRTEGQVAQKRADALVVRAARAGAAYQVLRPTTQIGGEPERWLEAARRRAAARYLLADAGHEEALLADETTRLTAGVRQLEAALADAVALPAPALRLAWPVAGEPSIVRPFGVVTHPGADVPLARRGVDLEVARGARALSPGAGTVRYAGPIRGLGSGIIVDHGAAWSVVAMLGELSVRTGEVLTARQPLGTAAAARLYVEVRLPVGAGGTPIPPASMMTVAPR